jgi:hypothetical protein
VSGYLLADTFALRFRSLARPQFSTIYPTKGGSSADFFRFTIGKGEHTRPACRGGHPAPTTGQRPSCADRRGGGSVETGA